VRGREDQGLIFWKPPLLAGMGPLSTDGAATRTARGNPGPVGGVIALKGWTGGWVQGFAVEARKCTLVIGWN